MACRLLLLAAALVACDARAAVLTRPGGATDGAEGCPVAGLTARCPPFTHKRHCGHSDESCAVRAYEAGDWATTDVGDAARLETAAARGAARRAAYARGANEAGVVLDPTAPTVVGFKTDSKFGRAHGFRASLWVAPAASGNAGPPAPADDKVKVKSFDSNTYAVANWTGGIATQGVVLEKAKALADALEDGSAAGRTRRRHKKESHAVWYMTYSPLAQLTGRYYEVALEHDGKEGGDAADAASRLWAAADASALDALAAAWERRQA